MSDSETHHSEVKHYAEHAAKPTSHSTASVTHESCEETTKTDKKQQVKPPWNKHFTKGSIFDCAEEQDESEKITHDRKLCSRKSSASSTRRFHDSKSEQDNDDDFCHITSQRVQNMLESSKAVWDKHFTKGTISSEMKASGKIVTRSSKMCKIDHSTEEGTAHNRTYDHSKNLTSNEKEHGKSERVPAQHHDSKVPESNKLMAAKSKSDHKSDSSSEKKSSNSVGNKEEDKSLHHNSPDHKSVKTEKFPPSLSGKSPTNTEHNPQKHENKNLESRKSSETQKECKKSSNNQHVKIVDASVTETSEQSHLQAHNTSGKSNDKLHPGADSVHTRVGKTSEEHKFESQKESKMSSRPTSSGGNHTKTEVLADKRRSQSPKQLKSKEKVYSEHDQRKGSKPSEEHKSEIHAEHKEFHSSLNRNKNENTAESHQTADSSRTNQKLQHNQTKALELKRLRSNSPDKPKQTSASKTENVKSGRTSRSGNITSDQKVTLDIMKHVLKLHNTPNTVKAFTDMTNHPKSPGHVGAVTHTGPKEVSFETSGKKNTENVVPPKRTPTNTSITSNLLEDMVNKALTNAKATIAEDITKQSKKSPTSFTPFKSTKSSRPTTQEKDSKQTDNLEFVKLIEECLPVTENTDTTVLFEAAKQVSEQGLLSNENAIANDQIESSGVVSTEEKNGAVAE